MVEEYKASFKIILGRSEKDKKKYGDEGTIFIGKQYMKMGHIVSLSNPVYLDVVRPHMILICGKRGSGKSYTVGVMVESMATMEKKVAKNISSLIFDTMGIYWTTKYPNLRDKYLLEEWGLEPTGYKDITRVFVPYQAYDELKGFGIPVDEKISLPLSDVSGAEWNALFNIPPFSEVGVAIERLINKLKEDIGKFDFLDIYSAIDKSNYPNHIKMAIENRFKAVENLGIFAKEGIELEYLLEPAKINIVDISLYAHVAGGSSVRALVIGLICRKILYKRLIERRKEELKYIEYESLMEISSIFEEKKKRVPLVWIFIDEAHEFLPEKGKTLATDALIQVIREGRQPGISLVLLTQQPGKIHTDAITQSDIVISHILTAKHDIDALKNIMQTYLPEAIHLMLMQLPKRPGAALVLDDKAEKVYQIQIRPRVTWHGGAEPVALIKK